MDAGARISCTLIFLVIVTACDKQEGTGSFRTANGGGASELIGDMKNRASDVKDGTMDVLKKAKEGAGNLIEKGKSEADDVVDKVKDGTENVKDKAGEMTAAVREKAQVILDGAMKNINEKWFDLAQSDLDQLDRIKGKLPESLQQKITQARTALAAAKTADQATTAVDGIGGTTKGLPGMFK